MSVQAVLEDFGTNLVKDVQDNLAEKQKQKAAKQGASYNANSNLMNSVKFYVSNKSGSIVFELTMAPYYGWVDKGRDAGPVSKEGQKNIGFWIRKKGLNPVKIISQMRLETRANKGITKPYKPRKKLTFEKATKALTFLVARKLKNDGYQGNNFYTEIITDGRLKKLEDDIMNILNEEIQITINEFK